MNPSYTKVTSLKDAIKTNVKDGCHLSIGGFTINRNPMAAVYEIIRQKIKQLHLYAHSNIMGFDRTTKKTRKLKINIFFYEWCLLTIS